MTYWDFCVENLNQMLGVGELRICVGFFVEKLGDKELNRVSQLFSYAQEIGIIARSEAELVRGTQAIHRAASTDARWGIVHMVSDDMDFPAHRWQVYWDIWFEGRY
ncbi:MAG TPA: hypothetical protein VMR02_03295 [Terracidiphilus sp.]|jgi:hypothetical protein|nr:hypothetical protein [Terracidiphilus sp.]